MVRNGGNAMSILMGQRYRHGSHTWPALPKYGPRYLQTLSLDRCSQDPLVRTLTTFCDGSYVSYGYYIELRRCALLRYIVRLRYSSLAIYIIQVRSTAISHSQHSSNNFSFPHCLSESPCLAKDLECKMHSATILSSLGALFSSVALAAPASDLSILSQRQTCEFDSANSPECWGDYSLSTNWYEEAPDTGVVREYWFEVAESYASPDGVERLVMSINGSIPGPTIYADWGDTIGELHTEIDYSMS